MHFRFIHNYATSKQACSVRSVAHLTGSRGQYQSGDDGGRGCITVLRHSVVMLDKYTLLKVNKVSILRRSESSSFHRRGVKTKNEF